MGTILEDPTQFAEVGGLQFGVVDPVAIASTTNMPAPRARVSSTTGTGAVAIIDLPWANFTGSITYIPAAAMTGVTGGAAGTPNPLSRPIAVAFTCTAKKALIMTFDGTSWYPSYTN